MFFCTDAFPFPLSPAFFPALRVASVWISVHMLQIYIQLYRGAWRTLEIIILRKTLFMLHSNCVEHMNLHSFCHAVQPLSSCERRCLAQIFQRPTYKFLRVRKCFKEQLLRKKFRGLIPLVYLPENGNKYSWDLHLLKSLFQNVEVVKFWIEYCNFFSIDKKKKWSLPHKWLNCFPTGTSSILKLRWVRLQKNFP